MTKPIGVFYEHPERFKPLFAALDARALPYEKIHAGFHSFDPLADPEYSLVINRVSSSSYLRGHTQAIFAVNDYLGYLESNGVRVINGTRASEIETSKALQLVLFRKLGIAFPKAIVVNNVSQLLPASEKLSFPLVVKPNIGGSGAGIRRFDSRDELAAAVAAGNIELGIDLTALLQEYVPTRGGHIHRVETLNGKFLYAIKVFPPQDSFNLCPAEICQVPAASATPAAEAGSVADGDACITTAAKRGIRVEPFTPPPAIIETVERIVAEARIDVGGIEYLIDDRTGEALFYDINALSNFIADAANVIGFDPFQNLVDYLESQMKKEPVTA